MSSETLKKRLDKVKMNPILLFLSNCRHRIFVLAVLYILAVSFAFTTEHQSSSMMASPVSGNGGVRGYQPYYADAAASSESDSISTLRAASPKKTEINREQTDSETTAGTGSETTAGAELVKDMEASLEKLEGRKSSKTIERMLVHTASLSLETEFGQLENVTNQIEEIVTTDGNGYVESQSSRVIMYSRRRATEMKLRVASQTFSDVVQAIQRLVKPDMIISVSKSSRDVTEDFVDASSRADVLEASRDGLKNLMKKAEKIDDVMKVRNELTQLTEQYESYRNRAKALQNQAKLSTLTVKIEERESESRPEKPKPWFNPGAQIQLAVHQIFTVLGIIGDNIVYFAIWLIPFFLCYVLVSACASFLLRIVS